MMIRKNAGIWAGFFSLGFSLLFLITSLQYDYTRKISFGPGFLPFWISVLMTVLSILYIIESFKLPVYFTAILPPKQGMKKIGLILLSFILFIVLADYLGFVITGSLFFFLLIRGTYRWFISLGIAIGVSFVLFYVFVELLQVPLPVNELGW